MLFAERDIVLANQSVCLSLCPMPVLRLKDWTCHTFWRSGVKWKWWSGTVKVQVRNW